ncbi:MAG: GNAT family N-acetyltransferase [Myxococcales bacterium]|nr:GNAT family N-acetyltransferase [Myxococcales bacterium]
MTAADLRLVAAGPADYAELEPMAVDFKIDDPVPRSGRELAALRALLADPALGAVYRVQQVDRTVGYAILCWGYSVEYGGRDAILDEFYIVPELRGRGLGLRVLALLECEARARAVVAVHLEVLSYEARNVNLYTRAGYTDRGSKLMTRGLI